MTAVYIIVLFSVCVHYFLNVLSWFLLRSRKYLGARLIRRGGHGSTIDDSRADGLRRCSNLVNIITITVLFASHESTSTVLDNRHFIT